MILADYLSCHRLRDSDPNELIPISFYITCPIGPAPIKLSLFPIQTCRSAWAAGEAPPPVHGANKGLDPHKKPEHQRPSTLKEDPPSIPRPTGTPRTEITASKLLERSKNVQHQRPRPVETVGSPPPIPPTEGIGTAPHCKVAPCPPRPLPLPPMPQRPQPHALPPLPKCEDVEIDMTKYTHRKLENAQKLITGIDIGETEEVTEPEIITPDDEDFVEQPPLEELVDPTKVKQTFVPKQGELTKLVKQINTRILRGTHLPGSLKDLKAAYLTSPHFKDIYVYLTLNRLPLNKVAARQVEANSRDYMMLDELLFKLIQGRKEEPFPVLCIPTSKVHILMEYYHSSALAGHTGIGKTYMTISQRFYCPNLADQLRAYITGCHVCQLFKKGKQFDRPFQKRVNLNVPAMTRISMDMKEMPPSYGYTHILVILCEVSNFMVALPLHSTRTQTILEAFQKGYMAYFGPPSHIVCDQDSAFTSTLMEAFTEKLGINMIMVSTTNHKSLLAEHGIKSLSNILVKHLSDLWSWYNCLPYAMLCYNAYSTPNLDSFSPYELVFGHKMTINHGLEKEPTVTVTGHFQAYYEKLKKNLKYIRDRLQKFRNDRTDMWNKNKTFYAYEAGQIVYMYKAKGAFGNTGSKKITCYYVGPLVIYKAVSPNQFLLMSLTGQVYPHLVEETRIKPGSIWTSKGNVTTLAQLKAVLSAGLKIDS